MVSKQKSQIELTHKARQRVIASRKHVESCLQTGETYYGINTGFGSLVDKKISPGDVDQLQTNLIRSHASGVGDALSKEVVRAMMTCLLASLSRGYSGVRIDVLEYIIHFLNNDFIPIVPHIGSVGASGDLAPLSHCMLPLMGEGKVLLPNGEIVNGKIALNKLNLPPIQFVAKEGLGLINGTHLMCGSAALLCHEYVQLLKAALCAASMSIDSQQASHSYLDKRINDVRVFDGGKKVSNTLEYLLKESEIQADRSAKDLKVQDPYSIRCIAPIVGASIEAFKYFRSCVEKELCAVTDNPLIFYDEEKEKVDIVSAGNFHGMPVALPLDTLAMSIAHVAGLSERRTYLMLSGRTYPMLACVPGLESGLMITQYTQAACCNEIQALASPASVHNITTCAGVEDYNSWGPRSAVKARRAIELAKNVIAIELLCGAEALERQRPKKSSVMVEQIHQLVRTEVKRLSGDRSMTEDVENLVKMISDNKFEDFDIVL